jgi:hypothetical protein
VNRNTDLSQLWDGENPEWAARIHRTGVALRKDPYSGLNHGSKMKHKRRMEAIIRPTTEMVMGHFILQQNAVLFL